METIKQTVGLGSPRVGYIGLGNMGRGMTKNLAEKGSFTGPLLIYNRTASRAEEHIAKLPTGKAEVSTSIADLVDRSDIIFTCIGDDKAMTETIDAALKAQTVKGKLFVDNSTIHPDTTNQLAKIISSAGAEFVACPVFGAPAMADAGQLICVLAGPRAAVDKVRPFTKGVIGKANIDFSDEPQGNATRLKVIGNTFILSMVETLSEAHVLAEKTGVGSDNLHKFIEAMFPGAFAAYSTRMMQGSYYKDDPKWGVDLARKDARHAMNLGKSVGVKMGITEVADEHLKAVKEHQGASGDIAGIYGAIREESGLKYELD